LGKGGSDGGLGNFKKNPRVKKKNPRVTRKKKPPGLPERFLKTGKTGGKNF